VQNSRVDKKAGGTGVHLRMGAVKMVKRDVVCAGAIGGSIEAKKMQAGMGGGKFSDEFGSESEYYGMPEDLSYDPDSLYHHELYKKHVGSTEVNQSGRYRLWIRRTHDDSGVEMAEPVVRTVGSSGCSAASITSAILQHKGNGAAKLFDVVDWMRANEYINPETANPKMHMAMRNIGDLSDGISAEYLGTRGSETVAKIKDNLADGNPVVIAIKAADAYTRIFQPTTHRGGITSKLQASKMVCS
jgi:hypothetical protein